ncbi:MAG: flagellar hook-associated protein FlgK [Polyangiaceae bacterium]|jgi:flagellar hook-associated protein 1 FlgK
MNSTSLFGLLNIASDGLAAQTAALDATSQNVSNANTPGYSEVTANLETTATGDTFAGSVQVTGVTRSYNALTQTNMLTQQGLGGAADARDQAVAALQNVVAPTSGTIGDSVNSFFASLTALESAPSDTATRAAVLQNATSLAQNISSTAAGLSTQSSALVTQAQGVATTLNGQLSQIAQLNGSIAQASAEGSDPSDMEDQRDGLVSQVSTEIGAQVIQGSSGSYTLLSSGTALVTGDQASSVSVGLDGSGNIQVLSQQPGGGSVDITANTTQGSLGGIVEAHNNDIPSVSSQLDQFAYNLATTVNAVQSKGYGLDGGTGRDLFTPPTTVAGAAAAFAVDPAVAGQPSYIAASSTAAGLPGGNDGAVALSQLSTQPLAGGAPPAQTFAAIASNVGDMASAADTESQTRDQMVLQAQNLNSSVSGVSLDQEMTNMTQFQNAYEASTKVIQTAQTLFTDLMDMMPAN